MWSVLVVFVLLTLFAVTHVILILAYGTDYAQGHRGDFGRLVGVVMGAAVCGVAVVVAVVAGFVACLTGGG